jgi:hypothetical protein
VITEQRFALARLLAGLSDDEWEQPCSATSTRCAEVRLQLATVMARRDRESTHPASATCGEADGRARHLTATGA